MSKKYGADIVVDSLVNHGVDIVFGIPGAKIDRLFETFEERASESNVPKMIVARHEQNAVFMAQAFSRITGKTGVVVVTSGPAVGNLVTGMMTAQAENDAVLAIGGQVPRRDLSRLTHQATQSVALLKPVTAFSAEIQDQDNISEVLANAFLAANGVTRGTAFVSLPQDIDDAVVTSDALEATEPVRLGQARQADIDWLAKRIQQAHRPVILAGARASDDATVAALRRLLAATPLPVVETFQGAGIVPRELEEQCYFGRVGLFHNQIGDEVLQNADLVITVGYDAIEYEPRNWHQNVALPVVAIDDRPAQFDTHFAPKRQLVGDMAATLTELLPGVAGYALSSEYQEQLRDANQKLVADDAPVANAQLAVDQPTSHPLAIIKALQKRVTDAMTVTTDIGSHYIWMARHFRSYVPRHFLMSNGMQTLGVGMPWAIAAAMVRPDAPAISVSGDGGFFFSAMELETAVRLGLNTVHLVWNDNAHYDMVKFQEELKYGHAAGVDFGPIDIVKYAESCGAKGLRVHNASELEAVLDEAFATHGPVVVDIPVDYSDNHLLGENLLPEKA